jgi:hypothetical protein
LAALLSSFVSRPPPAPPSRVYTAPRTCSNVNGHENDTGFPLKQADLLAFNKWLAAAAHGLGLGIGLKNGVDMVPQLQPHFDW